MDDSLNREIGDRLQRLRSEAGFSRAVVSERLGITGGGVQAHEEGRNGVKPDMLLAYARMYKVSAQFLLTGKSPEALEVFSKIKDADRREAWLQMGRAISDD